MGGYHWFWVGAIDGVDMPEGHEQQVTGTNWLAGGCIASMCAVSHVLYTFSKSKALHSRPGCSLLASRAAFELLFCVVVLGSLVLQSVTRQLPGGGSAGAGSNSGPTPGESTPEPPDAPPPWLEWQNVQCLMNMTAGEPPRDCMLGCEATAMLLQFSYLGSESYFFIIALDLLINTLPSFAFTDSAKRMKWYHAYVFVASALSVLALRATGAWGPSDAVLQTLCWNREHQLSRLVRNNLWGWLVTYVWLGLYYPFALLVLAWARWRLRVGIDATLATRIRRITQATKIVAVFSLYLAVHGTLYALVIFGSRGHGGLMDGQQRRVVGVRALALVMGLRGMADVLVWRLVVMRSLVPAQLSSGIRAPVRLLARMTSSGGEFLRRSRLPGRSGSRGASGRRGGAPPDGLQAGLLLGDAAAAGGLSGAGGRAQQSVPLGGGMIEEEGEDSLELNVALQTQLICFLLLGIRAAVGGRATDADGQTERYADRVRKDSRLPGGASPERVVDLGAAAGGDPAISAMMQRGDQDSLAAAHGQRYNLDQSTLAAEKALSKGNCQFVAYASEVFAELRELFGIRDEKFRRSLRGYTKPSFDGGSSGAIMLYSKDERYILKQISAQEQGVLLSMLPRYKAHMEPPLRSSSCSEETAPHSLICRFVACVRVTMYRTKLYFVVIENVFHPARANGREISQVYDIKGSWQNRNAAPMPRGSTARCLHCNARYVVGDPFWGGGLHERQRCPVAANGVHLPRVTFKDQDLISKIYLAERQKRQLLESLERDSTFLQSEQIMDYSLLLGVSNRRFLIGPAPAEEEEEEPQLNNAHTGWSPRDLDVSYSRQGSDEDSGGSASDEPVAWSGHGSRVSFATTTQEAASTQAQPALGEGEAGDTLHTLALRPSTEAATPSTAGSSSQLSTVSSDGLGSPTMMPSPTPWKSPAAGRARSASEAERFDIPRASLTRARSTSRAMAAPPPFFREDHGGLATAMVVGPETYYLGVVDVLQRWTWQKRLERLWKRVFLRRDPMGMSVMEPTGYRDRFVRHIVSITETPAGLGMAAEHAVNSSYGRSSAPVTRHGTAGPTPIKAA